MGTLRHIGLLGLLTGAFLFVGNVSTAKAWLKICNSTGESITYSHSEPDSGCGSGNCAWERVGWWTIANGACTTVYGGSANNKYFYWYAEATDGSPVWTSNTWEWQVPNSVHNLCQCIGCTTGGGAPCHPLLKHRELHTTATNYTLTIVP